MRDRLIEKLDLFMQDELGTKFREDILEHCADYLLENGVVVPPCKVGYTVWDTEGNAWKVFAITIWQDCISLKTVNSRHVRKTFTIGKRSIGKTVFLTEEEAERALKGGEG